MLLTAKLRQTVGLVSSQPRGERCTENKAAGMRINHGAAVKDGAEVAKKDKKAFEDEMIYGRAAGV